MTTNGHITRDEFFEAALDRATDSVTLPNGKTLELVAPGFHQRLAEYDLWLKDDNSRSEAEIMVRIVRLCAPIFTADDEERLLDSQPDWITDAAMKGLALLRKQSEKKTNEPAGAGDDVEAESAGAG